MPQQLNRDRGFRSFAPRYDVPQRGHTDIRFPKENEAEAGPQIDQREPFVDLLLTEGFREYVRLVVLPYVSDVRKALLNSAELDEKQRQRLVGSLHTTKHLITQVFTRAGEPVPEWLARQFQ